VVNVTINHSGADWVNECYKSAIAKVVKNLTKKGFCAEMTNRENHGYINSSEVYECNYTIGVNVGR